MNSILNRTINENGEAEMANSERVQKRSQKKRWASNAILILLGLLLIFSTISYFSNSIADYSGSFSANGSLGFTYSAGTEPVLSIAFHLPSDLAASIASPKVESGWSAKIVENDLAISGGLLQPGQSIQVTYFLTRYVAPRNITILSTLTTQNGNTFSMEGPLEVTESTVLHVLYYFQIFEPIATQFLLPIVFGGLFVVWWKRNWIKERLSSPPRKEKAIEENMPTLDDEQQKEPQVPPPPENPPPIPIGTPQPSVSNNENQEVCSMKYSWQHQLMDLIIYPSNRAIGSIKKYAKVSKKGSYQFASLADQPIPLKAESSDWHLLIHECMCQGIDGDLSRKSYNIPSNVRIQWEIVQGEGGFVKMSQSQTTSNSEFGEEVLFQPPHLNREEPGKPAEIKKIKIRVSSYHDDPSKPPDHEPLRTFITMEIQRKLKTDPLSDEYLYDYWVDETPLKSGIGLKDKVGACLPEHIWRVGSNIDGRFSMILQICHTNDFIRLEALGTDTDDLELKCAPSGGACKLPTSKSIRLSDVLAYKWKASAGEFPLGAEHGGDISHDSGREVVWHAPDFEGTVKISLLISDSTRQYVDESKTIEFDVQVKNPHTPGSVIPPVMPPPPATPKKRREEGDCEINVETESSDLAVEVDVSTFWATDSMNDNPERIKQSIENSVKERRTWNTEDLGTAVTMSDGASVGGSVAAGAKIRILEGEQKKLEKTEEIDSSNKGKTKISIDIEAPEDAKTGISAAAITVLKARSSCLEIPDMLYEMLEKLGLVSVGGETLERLKEKEEIIKLLKEIWKKEATAKDLAAAGFKEAAAFLIEKVGSYLFLNGEVEVKAEGSMEFDVGACHSDNSPVTVSASREFKMDKGEVEEPQNEEYTLTDQKQAVSSCSAARSLDINLKGEVKVEGKAIWGGEGFAYLNSLWATAWIADCKLSGNGIGETQENRYTTGCRFGGWFTLPPGVLEKFDTQNAGDLRLMVRALMEGKLQEMLDAGNVPSPISNPKGAEAKLIEILKEWLKYIQSEWAIFKKQE